MWKWLTALVNKVRGKKPQRVLLPATAAAYRLTGTTPALLKAWAVPGANAVFQLQGYESVPRRLRVSFNARPPLVAAPGAFTENGSAATLTYTTTAAQGWTAFPPGGLALTQGGTVSLTNYFSTNGAVVFAVASGTLPTGVTLASNGVLSASLTASLTPSTVTFSASTNNAYTLSAASASFVMTRIAANLVRPPPAGPLTMTVTTVPYTGFGIYLNSTFENGSGGRSKNLQLCCVNGIWYKVGGDYQPCTLPSILDDGGRQEIFQIDFAANTWTLKQPYFLHTPANAMQGALPDDPTQVTVGNEVWTVGNERNNQFSTAQQTAYVRGEIPYSDGTMFDYPDPTYSIQNMQDITAWNPATGQHRVVLAPRPTAITQDRTWASIYDPNTKRVISPNNGSCIHTLLVNNDGSATDVTSYYGGGSQHDYGVLAPDGQVSWSAAACHNGNRTMYLCDIFTGDVYAVDLDTGPPFTAEYTVTRVKSIPWIAYPGTSFGNQVHWMVWEPNVQALIIWNIKQPGYVAAWQPATDQLSQFLRQDNWTAPVSGNKVYGSTIVYDPNTQALYSVGGIDWWDDSHYDYYWKTVFTHA